MKAISANEAKTKFGNMLLDVQRAPVQINKNGKAVAIVVSANDYQSIEALKIQMLKERVQRANTEIKTDTIIDGEAFINQLLDEDGN